MSTTTIGTSGTDGDELDGARGESSFHALARLLRYARGYRRRIVLASLASVLNVTFDVMPEILIGIAIDVVVNREESFLAAFGVVTPESQIVTLGVLTLFIWAGESLFQYLYLILWRNLAQDLQADLRQDAYDQVQRQDMAFFESRSSGELTAILNDDVNQLERFLDGGANDILQVVHDRRCSSALVFFIVSPSIALLAITPIPVDRVGGVLLHAPSATPLYAAVRERVAGLCRTGSVEQPSAASRRSRRSRPRRRESVAAAPRRADDYVAWRIATAIRTVARCSCR